MKKIVNIHRRLTQIHHCTGTSVSGWASCAANLKRCQIHDRRQFGKRSWSDYPGDRWGWITDTGRCLGVGRRPESGILPDEILLAIEVPFAGSGSELRRQAEKFVRKLNRRVRRAH